MTEPSPTHAAGKDIRISRWNTFDIGGVRLPSRSQAMTLPTIQAAVLITGVVLMRGLSALVQMFLLGLVHRFANGNIGLLGVAETLPFILVFGVGVVPLGIVSQRLQKKFVVRTQGGASDEDSLVAVRFVVDGFEYGRDVGRISFHSNWFYFEGERTSFSASPHEAVYTSHTSPFLSSKQRMLGVTLTDGAVKVLLDSLSGDEAKLDEALLEWCEAPNTDPGIAILPPLDVSDRKNYSRSQQIYLSLGIGAFIVYFGFLALLITLPKTHWGHHFPPYALALDITSGVLGFGLHRAFVAWKRKKTFEHLEEIRAQLVPFCNDSVLAGEPNRSISAGDFPPFLEADARKKIINEIAP